MKDPRCGNREIKVQAITYADVWIKWPDDGTDDFELIDTRYEGDTEWDGMSHAECTACPWYGKVADLIDETPKGDPS